MTMFFQRWFPSFLMVAFAFAVGSIGGHLAMLYHPDWIVGNLMAWMFALGILGLVSITVRSSSIVYAYWPMMMGVALGLVAYNEATYPLLSSGRVTHWVDTVAALLALLVLTVKQRGVTG